MNDNYQELWSGNIWKSEILDTVFPVLMVFPALGCWLYSKFPMNQIALVLWLACLIIGIICTIFSWRKYKNVCIKCIIFNIIMIILCRVYMVGANDTIAYIVSKILLLIIWISILLVSSFLFIFLIFSPQRKSLSEKYLFIGRIKDLIKYVSSLVAFFAGGYFGWLIDSELNGLEKNLMDINKALSKRDESEAERNRALRSAVTSVQHFVINQVNILFSFLLAIFFVWFFILVIDLIRARLNHTLMDSFDIFESIGHMFINKFRIFDYRIFSCIKQPLICFYGWYKKKARVIAECDWEIFVVVLILFYTVAIFMAELLKSNLQSGFENWFLSQINQIQPSY